MSLILEALKKSEAKRRLGEAPDLETPFAAQRRRSSPLPLIVVAIVVAAGAGWWLLRTPAAPSGAVSTPAQEKPMVASAPATPVKQQPAASTASARPAIDLVRAPDIAVGDKAAEARRKHVPMNAAPKPVDLLAAPPAAARPPAVVVAPTNAPAAVAATTPPGVIKPEPAAPPASVAGLKKPEPPTVTATGPGEKKAEPTPGPALAAGVKKPEPAPGAASDSGAQPYYQLPFSVRKDLPSLKLSMHVYTSEPAQRFIILNDSRMIEGNSQEDLALREIRPDGAVFEFRGTRFFYPRDGL